LGEQLTRLSGDSGTPEGQAGPKAVKYSEVCWQPDATMLAVGRADGTVAVYRASLNAAEGAGEAGGEDGGDREGPAGGEGATGHGTEGDDAEGPAGTGEGRQGLQRVASAQAPSCGAAAPTAKHAWHGRITIAW
jgi:hypothetical protein